LPNRLGKDGLLLMLLAVRELLVFGSTCKTEWSEQLRLDTLQVFNNFQVVFIVVELRIRHLVLEHFV
tara:strand:+ start:231 stop:431 length:201 start_codon:yes stop_codon:yes gene_type:complete